MMPHQRTPPEARIQELRAEAEYHLLALEHIEAQIREQWGRVA
jgi:hypothetical protein